MSNDLRAILESMQIPKHKVFISYYHDQDQEAKNVITSRFESQMISQSVEMGDIDVDNSDQYVRRLIREDYVSGASVIIVLCGYETSKRKHVDWEVKAALDRNNNGSSGLVCVLMPSINRFSRDFAMTFVPERVRDNVESGYAVVVTYEDLLMNFKRIVDNAFQRRESRSNCIRNSKPMKARNG